MERLITITITRSRWMFYTLLWRFHIFPSAEQIKKKSNRLEVNVQNIKTERIPSIQNSSILDSNHLHSAHVLDKF